jgi:hypothetical protein
MDLVSGDVCCVCVSLILCVGRCCGMTFLVAGGMGFLGGMGFPGGVLQYYRVLLFGLCVWCAEGWQSIWVLLCGLCVCAERWQSIGVLICLGRCALRVGNPLGCCYVVCVCAEGWQSSGVLLCLGRCALRGGNCMGVVVCLWCAER